MTPEQRNALCPIPLTDPDLVVGYTTTMWHARERGIRAFLEDMPFADCPYSPDNREREYMERAAWHKGWKDTEALKAYNDRIRAEVAAAAAKQTAGAGARRINLTRYKD